MSQKIIKMKSVQQPELSAVRNDDLVDQFLQESDYLPAQGDQSWREQAALRISAGYEENDEVETPATIPARADRLSESNFDGRSNRGARLVAFFAVAILLPTVVVLTVPGILTADFWRANRAAQNPPLEPVAPLVQTANVPAPKETSSSPPSIDAARHSKIPVPAKPSSNRAPPLRPADTAQKLDTQSTAKAPLREASLPKSRSSTRAAGRDGDTSGFGSFVLGPDGRLQYRYFPTAASGPTATSGQPAEPDKAESDDPGFYAMVPDPDGTMRYKHFASKPTH